MENTEVLPDVLNVPGMESVYARIKDLTNYGWVEFRLEIIIAAIISVIGNMVGLYYVCDFTNRKNAGVVTLVCHLISGVILAAVVGKMVVSTFQVHLAIKTVYVNTGVEAYICFPYCLFLAGIAAIMTLSSSFFFLLTVTKGGRKNDVMPYTEVPKPQDFTIVSAPPAYKRFDESVTNEINSSETEAPVDQLPADIPI